MQSRAKSFAEGAEMLRRFLYHSGQPVLTEEWQAKGGGFEFAELTNVSMIMPMPQTTLEVEEQLDLGDMKNRPGNTNWVFKHHMERVAGEPMNPPPSHVEWAEGTDKHLSKADPDKFSHTYPERLWPKALMKQGIRYKIGDLDDCILILKDNPTTRQCFIPMYSFEDSVAALQGERVPCSLGWHIMIRGGKANCLYPMRSCDAVRHMLNDWAFAALLTQHVVAMADLSDKVSMGNLHFVCSSLHCFENDKHAIKMYLDRLKTERNKIKVV